MRIRPLATTEANRETGFTAAAFTHTPPLHCSVQRTCRARVAKTASGATSTHELCSGRTSFCGVIQVKNFTFDILVVRKTAQFVSLFQFHPLRCLLASRRGNQTFKHRTGRPARRPVQLQISALQHVAQHRLQDAAVLVVLDLHMRVKSRNDFEPDFGAIVAVRCDREKLPGS